MYSMLIFFIMYSKIYLLNKQLRKDENMTSKQRAYLRSQANTLDSIFQIGKTGLTDNLIKQLSDALTARELIKISVLETAPDTAKNLSLEIAEATNSVVVQVIGSKITLFRQKEKNSRYDLIK